jgi:hypothetical protein
LYISLCLYLHRAKTQTLKQNKMYNNLENEEYFYNKLNRKSEAMFAIAKSNRNSKKDDSPEAPEGFNPFTEEDYSAVNAAFGWE